MVAKSEQVERAVDLLVGGGVIAFPTDTVYGLGALSTVPEAVARIFSIKDRPRQRALIILLESPEAIDTFATDIPDYARKLVDTFWPGPLTLVFKRQPSVCDEVTAGGSTVGVRMPDHPMALELLRQLSARVGETSGIAAPSANRFGEPPATNVQEVIDGLGAPDGTASKPDFILDGGDAPTKLPSTVLSCVEQWPRVLRHGSTKIEEIEEVVGRWVDQ